MQEANTSEIRPMIMHIIKAASSTAGIPVNDIIGPRRFKNVALPRHVVCYLGVEFRYSLAKVGRVLGKRDHSTVLHARRRIEHEFRVSNEIPCLVDEIRQAALAIARNEFAQRPMPQMVISRGAGAALATQGELFTLEAA